jgi:ribosomal protein S27E
MDIQTAYKILEIPSSTAPKDIKAAYLNLVEVWHPDRFVDKPALYDQATEKLKQLNVAYETITRHRSFTVKLNSQQIKPPPEQAKDPFVLVRCINCTALNRVVRYGEGIVCGRCGSPLIRSGKSEMHRPNGRIPCGDDACQGVIGFDGRCTLCGHTLKQSSEFFGQPAIYAKSHTPAKMGAALFMAMVMILCLVSSTSMLSSANAHNDPGRKIAAKLVKAVPAVQKIDHRFLPASEEEYEQYLHQVFAAPGRIDSETAKTYQVCLRDLGYYRGRIDGRLGPQSQKSLKLFLFDFRPARYRLESENILSSLRTQVTMAQKNRTWSSIHRSGAWRVWLESLNKQQLNQAYEIMALEDTAQLQSLFYQFSNFYKKP